MFFHSFKRNKVKSGIALQYRFFNRFFYLEDTNFKKYSLVLGPSNSIKYTP